MAYLHKHQKNIKYYKPLVIDPALSLTYTNLKSHITDAIKEACYKTDARFYNIANAVQHIFTRCLEPGVDVSEGLAKVIDNTIAESVGIGCDLSVVVEGVFIGAFRASSLKADSALKTVRVLIKTTLQSIYIHKGDLRQAIEGLLGAIIILVNDNNLKAQEHPLKVAKEDILACAQTVDPKFADDIKEIFINAEDSIEQLYFSMLSARLNSPPPVTYVPPVIKHKSFHLSKILALK